MKKYYYLPLFFSFIFLMMYWIYQNELNTNLVISLSLSSPMQFLNSLFIMIDSTSLIFMTTVMLISSLVVMYSHDYMQNEKMFNKFVLIMLVFIVSMMVMVTSSNLFWIIVGWDGLGLSSFCLIMFFNNWSSMNSAMVTFMSNRLGDMFLISSIWMSISSMSSINWSYITEFKPTMSFLLCTAAFSKSAQIPLSCWLPLAMAAPTPVSSLVHSSTLITAGVFLLIRFFNIIQPNMMIFLVSSLTLLMASSSALWEFDVKKIIALSTLSHVSLMILFIYLENKEGALMHLVMHASFKSTLFMSAGTLIHMNCNNQDIRQMSIPLKYNKIWTMFFISNLSMMGIPFLSGFYSKEMMMTSVLDLSNRLFVYLITLLALMMTVMYSSRILLFMMMVKSNNIIMFEESYYCHMMISLLTGTSLSIFFGAFLSWNFNFKEYSLTSSFYSTDLKSMIFLVMLIGLCLSSMITNLKMKNHKIIMYMMNMWYLSSLTLFTQTYVFSSSFHLFKSIDMKGWLDISIKTCNKTFKEYKLKLKNSSYHSQFIKLWILPLAILLTEVLMTI